MGNRAQGDCPGPLPRTNDPIHGGPAAERGARWILRIWRNDPMKKLEVLKRDKVRNEGRTQVELAAEIRRRAYRLYEQRGRVDGHALEDWAQAEAEVREPERTPTAA